MPETKVLRLFALAAFALALGGCSMDLSGFSVAELGSENESRLFVLRTVLSVGFPVVPLALAALAGGAWRRWRDPRVALPMIFAGTGFAVLQSSATVRELYILPFIAPLA